VAPVTVVEVGPDLYRVRLPDGLWLWTGQANGLIVSAVAPLDAVAGVRGYAVPGGGWGVELVDESGERVSGAFVEVTV
jgi:hypothetical protein